MTLRAGFVVAVVVAAMGSGGCSGAPSDEGANATPVLDGAYYAPTDGPFIWTAYGDDHFAAVNRRPECTAVPTPDACILEGTFVFDAASGTLRVIDAATGTATAYHVDIGNTEPMTDPGGGQVLTTRGRGVVPLVVGSLVNPTKVSGDSSQSVVTDYAISDPRQKPELVKTGGRNLLYTCVALLNLTLSGLGHGDQMDPKPEPPPPIQIGQTAGCGRKK